MQMNIVQKVPLWCRIPEENHDKLYELSLVETIPGLFSVSAQYGRRGASMREQVWVERVCEPVAKKKFESVLMSKLKKGYLFANMVD